MKKYVALLLAVVCCMLFCACHNEAERNETNEESAITEVTEPIETEPAVYQVGDTAGTDIAEVSLLDIAYADEYSGCDPGDGYSFVVAAYSLKNIGKQDFGYFPSYPHGNNQGLTNLPGEIMWVDYNDGFVFAIGDVGRYDISCFQSPCDAKLEDFKPLSEETIMVVAVCVPNEVVDNTEAPLHICFNLEDSSGKVETVTFAAR